MSILPPTLPAVSLVEPADSIIGAPLLDVLAPPTTYMLPALPLPLSPDFICRDPVDDDVDDPLDNTTLPLAPVSRTDDVPNDTWDAPVTSTDPPDSLLLPLSP